MRRLITAFVVPVALIMAIAIAASAADAGKKPHSVKTTAKIESITTPPPDDTWVFKGQVKSKNPKCIGKRDVAIYPVVALARGSAPSGPTAYGKTKKDGSFVLDSGFQLLLVAPYVADVIKSKPEKGLTCTATTSKPFELPQN